MKGIKIVLNGVTIQAEDATCSEVQDLLKLATTSELQINKQQYDAQLALATMTWNRLDAWTTKVGEYFNAFQSKVQSFKSAYLERKYALRNELIQKANEGKDEDEDDGD